MSSFYLWFSAPYGVHDGLSVAIAGYAGLRCQMACSAQQASVIGPEFSFLGEPQCGELDSTYSIGVLMSIAHHDDGRFA